MTGSKPTVNKPTSEEWDVVTAVEQFWKIKKHFPGTEELSKILNFPQDKIQEILDTEYVIKRFDILGIDPNAVPLAQRGELKKNQTGLTDKQLAVVETILNPMDKRGHREKLGTLGVKPTTYQGWMSNKTFTDYMNQRAEDMFGDSMPLAKEALVRKVMRGDIGAIKLYMEMNGKVGKTQESTTDLKLLLLRVTESLQRHVKDPVILQAIAEDMRQINEGHSPVSITRGELVNDDYGTIIT